MSDASIQGSARECVLKVIPAVKIRAVKSDLEDNMLGNIHSIVLQFHLILSRKVYVNAEKLNYTCFHRCYIG
jgi:hypothetical protein